MPPKKLLCEDNARSRSSHLGTMRKRPRPTLDYDKSRWECRGGVMPRSGQGLAGTAVRARRPKAVGGRGDLGSQRARSWPVGSPPISPPGICVSMYFEMMDST